MTPRLAPDISICIANYNGGELVLKCIESVTSQKGNFTIEIIIHDDASTDGSATAIAQDFPEVRLLRSSENSGFCISNNRMVSAARGRYVLLLNNDAALHADSLQTLYTSAETGMQDCILGLPQRSLTDGLVVDHGYRTDPFLNPIPIMAQGTHEAGVVTGACLWIPKVVWEQIGGFPEWFESVAEDIFMCFAARLLGHRVVVLDAPIFDHWIGKNLGGGKVVNGALRSTIRRRTLSERNKTFVMLCCYPWWALLMLMPFHAATLAMEAIFLAVTGTPIKSIWRIYGGIPVGAWARRFQIRELRKHMMQQRQATWREVFAFSDWLPHKPRLLLRHGRPTLG